MILLTGATGLAGLALARRFAAAGLPARLLTRDARRAVARLPNGPFELFEGDMGEPETYESALRGVRRVLLCSSASPSMENEQTTFIGACRSAGVEHVVKFSGGEIGFDPERFAFTRMHERIEDALEASGLAWTHVRPSQFMQVYLREAPAIARTGELRLPNGAITLAPVDVEDIAEVLLRLLTEGGHEGESLSMTGPEALGMDRIAQEISRVAEREVRYVPISPEARREGMLAAGAPAWFADALLDQAHERLRNPTAVVDLSTHERFGVAPTSFARFLDREAAALRPAPTGPLLEA